MSFDSMGRYTANHKASDHVGNMLPDIGHSEGMSPHLGDGGKVAEWLPVQFFDKHFENWFVVMPGKAVALDPDGALMPAQYGLTSATVTYTQNDIDAGVLDVATGLPVTAAKTVNLDQLTGVRHGSWTLANAGTGSYTSGFMGRFGVAFNDATIKYPIGVAPYAYLQWAGGDGSNPSGYRHHNYNMQHRVAVLCDYVIKLPLVPAQTATEAVDTSATGSALVFGTAAVHSRANAVANATGRYNATYGTVPVLATYPVIALALAEQNLAIQTPRTAFAVASTGASDTWATAVLVNERSSLAAVTAAGDYWVDYPKGVIFIYSSDGSTLPTALSGATSPTITYYRTDAAASVVSKFACVVGGAIVPGSYLKVTANSNLVLADPASDNFAKIVGQVLSLEVHPKDALDMVRTGFSPALSTSAAGSMANAVAGTASLGAGQMDMMPGSATGGMPDAVNYAGAANTMVIINLIGR